MKKTFKGSIEFDGILYEDIKITITGLDLDDCILRLRSMRVKDIAKRIFQSFGDKRMVEGELNK